jgi:hypothetical protein
LAGYAIREVPTTLSPDGRNRPPHLRTWRDGWRHLLFMLLFTPRWLFLIPGTLLAGSGLIGMVACWHAALRCLGPWAWMCTRCCTSAQRLIIGAQLVHFALLVKWIAVVAGIVREPPWVTQARRHTSVEFGLVIGALVFLAGLAWTLALVSDWRTAGFSALDTQSTMRSVIPAATLMALGVQASASALLAGALQLAWKSSKIK